MLLSYFRKWARNRAYPTYKNIWIILIRAFISYQNIQEKSIILENSLKFWSKSQAEALATELPIKKVYSELQIHQHHQSIDFFTIHPKKLSEVLPPGGAITLVLALPPPGAFAFSTAGGPLIRSFVSGNTLPFVMLFRLSLLFVMMLLWLFKKSSNYQIYFFWDTVT